MREHLLELGDVGGDFVGANGFEAFPQFENCGVVVSSGDGFLGDPFEDLDDGSVGGAHHDGRAVRNEAFGAEGEAHEQYYAMKIALAAIVDAVPPDGAEWKELAKVTDAIGEFVTRFP